MTPDMQTELLPLAIAAAAAWGLFLAQAWIKR